jgi:hypothetical protein
MFDLSLDIETFDLLALVAENEGASLPCLIRETFLLFVDFRNKKFPSPRPESTATLLPEHCLEAVRRDFVAYAPTGSRMWNLPPISMLETFSMPSSFFLSLPDNSPEELAE